MLFHRCIISLSVLAVPVAKGEPFSEEILPIGRTAAFPCIATGLPKPMIEWGRGMAPLPDDPRYSVAKDGSLVIRDVKLDDRGEFICIATNAAGSMIVTTAKLDVQSMEQCVIDLHATAGLMYHVLSG